MKTRNHVLAAAIAALLPAAVAAQATPTTNIVVNGIDGDTSPPVQPPATTIDGGTRYTIGEAQGHRPGGTAGVNLLQSFQDFILGVGDEVLFTADPALTTENIIARVTGGNPAEIYGRIASDVAGANLYFLNPAGIFFGSTSSLDVQGSFHASTADVLRMQAPDGTTLLAFSGDSALALAHPVAFGFVNAAPATITIDGATLSTRDGAGLSLVGGNLTIGSADPAVPTTRLEVTNGRLQLVAAGVPGDVGIVEHANGLRLSLPAGDTTGRIDLKRAQLQLTRHVELGSEGAAGIEPTDPGEIGLLASELRLDGAAIRSIADQGNQDARAGSVLIEAASATLVNGSAIEATAQNNSRGGNVEIRARPGDQSSATLLSLSGASVIDTDTQDESGTGLTAGGDVEVAGFDLVRLSGESQIRSDAYGNGSRTGNVSITAGQLLMSERAEVSTGSFGANLNLADGERPGSVFIAADAIELRSGGSIESISAQSGGFFSTAGGDGGDVVITVRSLLAEGAYVDPSRPFLAQASGVSSTIGFLEGSNGGNILINAAPNASPAESIQLLNGGRIGAEAVSGGTGGRIEIRARHILVSGVNEDLAAILDQLSLPVQIPGGSVSLQIGREEDYAHSAIAANSLVIKAYDEIDNSTLYAPFGLGESAGSIELSAEEIELADGGLIAAFTEGAGDGGRIGITTDRLLLSGSSRITTDTTLTEDLSSTKGGRGGNVAIRSGLVRLTDDAEISSDVDTDATGDGGNVFIEADRIELLQGPGAAPEISTDTAGPGAGGNLVLIAHDTLSIDTQAGDDAGGVFANSTFDTAGDAAGSGDGAAGSIFIAAGNLAMSGGAIAAATTGSGEGGDIVIGATDTFPAGLETPAAQQHTGRVTLADGARISVRSSSTGIAGDVTISVDDRLSLDRSSITTQADQSFGGNVTLSSGNLIDTYESQITAATEASGAGNGGNVAMSAPRIAINHGLVSASANAGNGGNIDLSASVALLASAPVLFEATDQPGTVFDATSELGVDGQVVLSAPEVSLDSGLAALTTEFLDPSRLLRPSCDVAATGSQGSFAVRPRAGAPVSPEELLVAFDPTPPVAVAQAGAAAKVATRGGTAAAADVAFRGGHFGEAAIAGERAVRDAAARGDAAAEAAALGLLGNAQTALGDIAGAQANLTRGIQVAVAAADSALAAELSNDLGNHWSARQDQAQALAAYRQSAKLATDAGDTVGAARALASAARAALRASEPATAQALLADAHASLSAVAAGQVRTELQIHLARSHTDLAESGGARDQNMLAAHELLTAAATDARAAGDARALSYALGNTGHLYELEGRTTEGLYLTRQALRTAEPMDAADLLYRWHWQSARLLRAAGQPQQALDAYRRAVELLEESRQDTLARYGDAELHFRRAVAPVYREFVDLLLQEPDGSADLAARLQEARGTMELLKGAELRDYFRNACIAELQARTESLDEVAGHAAIIYPILLDDRLEILVSTGGSLHRARAAVPASRVESTAQAFRAALQDLGSVAYRDQARQLYDWIMRPIEPVLKKSGATTLVFVPGGALRAIPMGALMDGDQFLVERYALAVTPSLSLIDPKPLDRSAVRMFAAGISESVRGQPALPNVPAELEAIRRIFGGESLLDAEFQVARVGQAIKEQRPTIVHIASHGVFTGDPEQSYLLAYDAPLTMERLGEMIGVARFREDPLALLVLSACQTAEGDDRASLGLAGVAISAGARSAMGSLWSISDDAAVALVTRFYGEIHGTDASRAEALRRAQLDLLGQQRFQHPFYWSPFLMINNWL